ncbi:stealth family protein [Verrucosispora sp. WMMA2121]|uniref:stealth family protein n=1 Tax=Verrucosispora sp. WMMA2121 TaxID=3015164 RepID=UPI0022B729EB|nr:stealth family protein [Verrucosispora sp. WMMA2121]MCZ7420138.1 stealth family protein [Verrucosispora sp. WMMA2121]
MPLRRLRRCPGLGDEPTLFYGASTVSEGRWTERTRMTGEQSTPAETPRALAEPTGLVDVYRRVLSPQARRAIAKKVSPRTRHQLKQWVARASRDSQLADRRAERLARRRPELLTGEDRTVVVADQAPRIALVAAKITPLRARAENLAAVTAALDEAGVAYFRVRGASDRSSVVAVDAADRDRAHVALADACGRVPGYVTTATAGDERPPVAGFEPRTWKRLAEAPVLRLTWYRTDPRRRLVLGQTYGCEVEFWNRQGNTLVAPRPNPVAVEVDLSEPSVLASESLFTGLVPVTVTETAPTRPPFVGPRPDDVTFPVDVVYTWVDGTDPDWLRRRAAVTGVPYHSEAASAARFLSRDELRYSLRSLHLFAPWVRNIYLVTDDQVPPWLEQSVPGIRVVSHREIFADPSVLPTYNSHAIESQLHHIEGLSEHFLYFNDDVFLGTEVLPRDFFLANGISRFFPSPALVPPGVVAETDIPSSAAGKNNRALIAERFGTVLTQKMKHMPHALRRSVLYEIEENFAAQHRQTAASRFRSLTDISIASSLHHYYSFHTGRAVPGNLRYAIAELSDPDTPARLAHLLARRDRHVFCLNDAFSTEEDLAAQLKVVTPFLDTYFPVPSPWERP